MGKRTERINICGQEYQVPITGSSENDISLFISTGEYPVYDIRQYDFMQEDIVTEKAYISAIKKNVEDKTVLDIGTGANMDWAMYSLDHYAKSAVGVEVQKDTFELAKKELEEHIYKDDMEVVNTLSLNYTPKEKFDICISEIIGTIGGSEGVAVALKDAKERLLKPNGKMLPYQCITKAGAICLQDSLVNIGFHEHTLPYLEQAFNSVGNIFDIRLTLTHNRPKFIISTHGIIETLNFEEGELKVEDEETCQLVINKSGRVDGLLLWINLKVDKDGKTIDSLYSITSWETVYIPLFELPIKVKKGDILAISCKRKLSDDGIHPDYFFKANLFSDGNLIMADFDSYHHSKEFGTKEIYKQLFKKIN